LLPGDLFMSHPALNGVYIMIFLVAVNAARSSVSARSVSVRVVSIAMIVFLGLVIVRLVAGPSDWGTGPRGSGLLDSKSDRNNYTAYVLQQGTDLERYYVLNRSAPSPVTSQALAHLNDLASRYDLSQRDSSEFLQAAEELAIHADAYAVSLATSDDFFERHGVVRGGFNYVGYFILVAFVLLL